MSHIFDALNKNSDDDPKSKASREKMIPPSNEDEETTGDESRPEALAPPQSSRECLRQPLLLRASMNPISR